MSSRAPQQIASAGNFISTLHSQLWASAPQTPQINPQATDKHSQQERQHSARCDPNDAYPDRTATRILKYRISLQMETQWVAHIIEDFNHKHVWWGSIPGMFRSNIVPPIVGFKNLTDLLYKTDVHHGHRD